MIGKERRRLTPEHLLAMKAGRERAKERAATMPPERSRGRPAMRAEAPTVLAKGTPGDRAERYEPGSHHRCSRDW